MKTALKLSVELAKHYEGLSLTPYLCPASVPTIGYGNTHYTDGRKVTLEDPPITEAQAELMLIQSLSGQYMPAALQLSPGLAYNQKALAAITDFVFNLGSARYRASTLRKRIDVGDMPAAREEIARWVYSGGRMLPGLVKRRAAEAALLQE